MPWKSHSLGDATGARSGPLAKMVLYYKTHLAAFVVAPASSARTLLIYIYNDETHHVGTSWPKLPAEEETA